MHTAHAAFLANSGVEKKGKTDFIAMHKIYCAAGLDNGKKWPTFSGGAHLHLFTRNFNNSVSYSTEADP